VEEQERQQAEVQPEPELLYHYTDQNGLLGIIEKQEFWATDVRFLNDMEEFEAGLKIAVAMAEQAYSEFGEAGRIPVAYIESELRFSFSERPIFSISFAGPLKRKEALFASIDDPGDRLNMWRGYSWNGPAYSIGLSREGNTTDTEGVDLYLQECSYLKDTKEKYLTEILNGLGDVLNECIGKRIERVGNGTPIDDAVDEARGELRKGFSRILPDLKSQLAACKHEGFWEEREWRITVCPPQNDKRVFYKSGRFGITPRFPIRLRDSDGSLPITRIVVGPSPHITDSIESLNGFLKRNGYSHVQVSASKIPYRNW